jgi:small subunit ribosomal protein S27Ae
MHKYYKITDDGKIIRLNPNCPRCSAGFLMAKHYDRETCGKCGYTVFKKHLPKKKKDLEDDTEEETPTVETTAPKEDTSAKGKKKKGKK